MARDDPQWRSKGKDGTKANYYRNKEKEVGMDWPYSSEACDKRDRHLAGILKERGKWEGQDKRGEGVWRKSWRQSELSGVSFERPAKIGCDGGALLRPYVTLGIKRHKSSTGKSRFHYNPHQARSLLIPSPPPPPPHLFLYFHHLDIACLYQAKPLSTSLWT